MAVRTVITAPAEARVQPLGANPTEVALTYDWSRMSPPHRDIAFPPFGRQHLDNSLKHLADLAESARPEQ